jgi:hypothetical protein
VTDQWRNTPARPSNIRSVAIALPFLNTAPAIAGSSAKANDAEAREDDSVDGSSPLCFARGLRMSRASPRLYSVKLELLRRGMPGSDASLTGDSLRGGGLRRVSSRVNERRSPWLGAGAEVALKPDVVAFALDAGPGDREPPATFSSAMATMHLQSFAGIWAIAVSQSFTRGMG